MNGVISCVLEVRSHRPPFLPPFFFHSCPCQTLLPRPPLSQALYIYICIYIINYYYLLHYTRVRANTETSFTPHLCVNIYSCSRITRHNRLHATKSKQFTCEHQPVLFQIPGRLLFIHNRA